LSTSGYVNYYSRSLLCVCMTTGFVKALCERQLKLIVRIRVDLMRAFTLKLKNCYCEVTKTTALAEKWRESIDRCATV